MIVIFTGATVIAMFPAEDDEGKKATPKEFAIVLGINLICAVCVTCELITARLLSERGVDGKYIGLNFLITTGGLGSILMFIATALGAGIYATGWDGFGLMMAAAFVGVISFGLVQYAMAIGVAAVVSSIFNLNPAILAAMAYFFLNQALTAEQVIGIGLSLLGAVFLSMKDNAFSRIKTKFTKTSVDQEI